MSATNRGSTRKPHDFYPTPIPTGHGTDATSYSWFVWQHRRQSPDNKNYLREGTE